MASRKKPSTKPIQKVAKIKQKLDSAEDLAFLPDDSLVVADRIGKKIKIFDTAGSYVKCLADGVKALGVSTNRSGLVAFTDTNNGKSEVRIMTDSGDVVHQWGDEMVWKPRSVEITYKGHILVTDLHVHARYPVGVYTMDGQSVLKFGQSEGASDVPIKPLYLSVDPFDRVLLVDKESNTVRIYDSNTGKFLLRIKDEHPDGISRRLEPRGLATDAQGNIIVCDYGSNRIAVYAPDGRFINNMLDRNDGLVDPYSVSFSRSGFLAVGCSTTSGSIRKVRIYQVLQSSAHHRQVSAVDDDDEDE